MTIETPLYTKVKTPGSEKVPAKKGYSLVRFFEPGYPFEKSLDQSFAWLSHVGNVPRGKIQIGEVDCSLYKSVCDQYKIEENPTILMFKDGEPIHHYRREHRGYEYSEFKRFLRERGVNLAMKDLVYGHI